MKVKDFPFDVDTPELKKYFGYPFSNNFKLNTGAADDESMDIWFRCCDQGGSLLLTGQVQVSPSSGWRLNRVKVWANDRGRLATGSF